MRYTEKLKLPFELLLKVSFPLLCLILLLVLYNRFCLLVAAYMF